MLNRLRNELFKPALFLPVAVLLLANTIAFGQGTAFTYQGKLIDTGNPANGSYDFELRLFDTQTVGTGTQQGSTVTVSNVTVINGIFTVQLDFGGGVFPGADRFLEIAVKPVAAGSFTTLSPRQQVTSTPYTIRSVSAATADTAANAAQLGGLSSSGFIQNTTTQQESTNFNVSGTGTLGGTLSANVVNTATQYNIGGSRVLSNPGFGNLFAGVNAGASNTTGFFNSFFGDSAGFMNATACCNSFFGTNAGYSNTTGLSNSFFGAGAGTANTMGEQNAFFGGSAGASNTTGNNNSFFGGSAGFHNTTGGSNSFFGSQAGQTNTSGVFNAFFGQNAGANNTTACCNSFFGQAAGSANTIGENNAFFGAAAGAANTEGNRNAFFGENAGAANTTGSFNAFFGRAAGFANTTGGSNSFFGLDAGFNNNSGQNNSFFGDSAGANNTTGNTNSFFGFVAGFSNTSGQNNSFFGQNTGVTNTTGTGNTMIGNSANVGSNNLTNATAIGANALVSADNSLVLGSINSLNGGTADTNVGIGTTAPTSRLHIVGNALVTGNLTVSGTGALSGNIVTATTQFNIGVNRLLSNAGSLNLFAGVDSGTNNTGSFNSFFGASAGFANSTGANNSFFGNGAGLANTMGSSNSFFGTSAGLANTKGGNNSFVGITAGNQNTMGQNNSFFGQSAGSVNTTGSNNSMIGGLANLGSNNLTNATAIGANALVTANNSLVLGSINGTNGATVDTNVGIGTTAPATRLQVVGDAGFIGSLGVGTTAPATRLHVVGNTGITGNLGIGTTAPAAKLDLDVNSGHILLGHAGCSPGFNGIGFGSSFDSCSNYSLLGNGTDTVINRPLGGSLYFREGNVTQMSIVSGGVVSINNLGTAGGSALCRNGSGQIAQCSSSLRYKTDVNPFTGGLEIINRLRPITFAWRQEGSRDLGLGAEDVARVEPLLITRNTKGEIEGVKYDHLTVVLINAIKEQQAQIAAQQKQIDELKAIKANSSVCVIREPAEFDGSNVTVPCKSVATAPLDAARIARVFACPTTDRRAAIVRSVNVRGPTSPRSSSSHLHGAETGAPAFASTA